MYIVAYVYSCHHFARLNLKSLIAVSLNDSMGPTQSLCTVSSLIKSCLLPRKHRLKSQSIMNGYIHSDAFDSGTLAVGTIHHLHYEQYGKPDGKPGTQYPDTHDLGMYKCMKAVSLTLFSSTIPPWWTRRSNLQSKHSLFQPLNLPSHSPRPTRYRQINPANRTP